MATGLRPRVSAIRPDRNSIAALPAANTDIEMPATAALCSSASMTNTGTSEIRTPNTAQPFANPDASAAR